MQNSWDVSIRRGWIIGLTLIAVLLAVTVGLVVYAITVPISLWLFLVSLLAIVTLGIAIRLAYQLWGLISASYSMDRNAVVIHWGGVEHVIPMAHIREVKSGKELQNLRLRPGIRWPGCFAGIGKAEDCDTILFYASQAPARQVVLRTDTVAYAISPDDLETFLPALAERLEMGPTQEIEESSSHPAFLDWEIWQDRWGLGLLLGVITLLVLLVGLLCWRFPFLPAEIGLRFNVDDAPILLTDKIRVFYLSLIGLIFTFVNGTLGLLFYHRERTASYFLWSGLLAVIVTLWAAVIMLFSHL